MFTVCERCYIPLPLSVGRLYVIPLSAFVHLWSSQVHSLVRVTNTGYKVIISDLPKETYEKMRARRVKLLVTVGKLNAELSKPILCMPISLSMLCKNARYTLHILFSAI